MPHTAELTESQVRHVDTHRNGDTLSFDDMDSESEARHVDEYRHAMRLADDES